ISGGLWGVLLDGPNGTVFNTGTIRTRHTELYPAIQGGAGVQDVINSGRIVGNVVLGAGDDGFTATGRGFVVGEVHGGEGADDLVGARADDWLFGEDDNDVLAGRGGNDHLYGGNGNDDIWGGKGRDVMFGGTGGDTLFGEAGADKMHGGADNDSLFGGGGNDRLFGDVGNDPLYGGGGKDVLRGGSGGDYLVGERGNDRLIGGSGADIFAFELWTPNFGNDRITDFEDGVDKIDLSCLGIADMNAFLASALSEVNGNAVIDLSEINPAVYSGTITLVNIAQADITPLDFV
ncbi:MAG TPA: calcium-binding protein, partial [Rhodobacterales bacterium]|nr:calcium-binding protein [Rhodobacterales bacterium]